MKKAALFIIPLLALSVMFTSCSQGPDLVGYLGKKASSFEMLSVTDAPVTISPSDGAGHGKPVTLTVLFNENNGYSYSYQWYTCDDDKTGNAQIIEGADSSSYTTGVIEETGRIYRYFCRVTRKKGIISETADTQVYYVACTGVPTLYIYVENGEDVTSKGVKKNATIRFVSDSQDVTVESTIKGRGNASWDYFPKRSYTLKLSSKTAFGSLQKSKKWAIVSNYNDKTLLRNWFTSYIDNTVLAGEDWDPLYLHVDLVMNGQYLGSYVIAETIKIDSKRIDVPDISECAALSDGGFILEVNWRMDEPYNFVSAHGVQFSLSDPDLEDADNAAEVFAFIKDKINAAEEVLYGNDTSAFGSYFDLDSFVDGYITNELAKTWDGRFRTSVYFWYNPSDGLVHGQVDWDYDDSWGGSDNEDRLSTDGFYLNGCAWYEQLLRSPEFVAKVKARWISCYDALLSSTFALQAKADSIAISAELNFRKWNILGTRVFTSAPGYRKRKTYQSEVDFMKNWISERISWLDTAIREL